VWRTAQGGGLATFGELDAIFRGRIADVWVDASDLPNASSLAVLVTGLNQIEITASGQLIHRNLSNGRIHASCARWFRCEGYSITMEGAEFTLAYSCSLLGSEGLEARVCHSLYVARWR